jgi:predicted nucleic acid-binding protein
MSSSTIPQLVVLDTSVISAYVKNEMCPEEAVAFKALLDRLGRGSILASTVSLEEINEIPLTYRSSHLDAYNALVNVREIEPTASTDNRENVALRRLLRDENDARLITHCQKTGVAVFLTLDKRTILKNASEIEALSGVKVLSPSQYLSATSRST